MMLSFAEAKQRLGWLGMVTKVYEVDDIQVFEYVETKSGMTAYHGFIDGDDTCISWGSVHAALIGCIARKHLEINEARHFSNAVFKMFGIPG